MSRMQLRPLLYLGGTVLFWGTSFAATKSAMESFSPMTVIWLRMLVSSALFLPFWNRLPKSDRRPGDWKLLGASMLFLPCLYFTLEGYAVYFTTSSQAGVIAAIMPLMVAGGAWLLLRERLGWQGAVGLAASIVGIAVLSLSGSVQQSAPAPALGNILELGAMVAAAGSTLAIKHLSARYDTWFLTGLQSAVGAVFFAPLALASGTADLVSAPLSAWAAVAYLGAFAGLGAFGLYNSALKALPASRAALAINLIPAVAMLSGWLALGELMSLLQIGACALIVGAVVFAEVTGHMATAEPGTR